MSRVRQILFLIYLGFSFLSNICYAQVADIDSIAQMISDQPNDTSKVSNFIKISKRYYNKTVYDQAQSYGQKALEISLLLDFDLGIAESYYIIARINNKLIKPATALEFYSKAQPIFQALNRIDRLAAVYNNVGLIYKRLGRYPNAIEFLSKSYDYYQILNNTTGAASASNNLGSIYRILGSYSKSAEEYFKSLKLFEDENSQIQVARISVNLANLYYDQKAYQKALKFSNKALRIYEDMGHNDERANLLGNVAETFFQMGEIDTAFFLYQVSYKIFNEVNDQLGIALSLDNIGTIHSTRKEYEKAVKSHHESLELLTVVDQRQYTPGVMSNMAYALTMMGSYDKALSYLNRSLQVSSELGSSDGKLESLKRLYELYEFKGNYETSLNYFKQYSQLKDSLFNKDKTKQMAYIEESYEIEKRERENELLRQQQATQDEVIKRQTLQVKMLIGGVITFLLFAIYYYRINQQKKRTNELLSQQNEEINKKQKELLSVNQSLQLSEHQLYDANQELQTMNSRLETTVKKRTSELQRTNQELDTFLYQSSHALRRPIVHVKGLVQLARIEPDPQEIVGLYDKLDDTATRMDLMLKKLVMASEIYVTKPSVERIDFEHLIMEVWDSLTDTLKVQSVRLEYTIPKIAEFKADRKLIKIMFLNLLENAIFYNEATKRQKALVTIGITSNPKSLDIKVNDNGIGISEESIASIFDLFSVGPDKTRGYGLGLYIVKKAVEKLQGVITVSSKRNEFTTFHITLPKEV